MKSTTTSIYQVWNWEVPCSQIFITRYLDILEYCSTKCCPIFPFLTIPQLSGGHDVDRVTRLGANSRRKPSHGCINFFVTGCWPGKEHIFFSIWSEISVKVKLKFQISSVSGCYNTKKLALSARYKGYWTSSSFQTFEC